jgi:hypothetical protein
MCSDWFIGVTPTLFNSLDELEGVTYLLRRRHLMRPTISPTSIAKAMKPEIVKPTMYQVKLFGPTIYASYQG